MSDLSKQVYELLLNNNIKKEDMIMQLENIKSEIDRQLWEKIQISPLIFFKLKDTVFYNFEYCNYNNNNKGKTTIKDFGKNYPLFMFNFYESTYILNEDLLLLQNELNDIKNKWNSNIYSARLYTKIDFDWKIDDKNSSKLIIYDEQTETPMQYGIYNNLNSGLLDSYGNNIKNDENIIFCAIKKIDMYREYNSLTQMLELLLNSINNALNSNKGLYIEFNY